MIAEDIMTQDPMTADARMKVRDAIQILQTLEIRHLPVLNNDGTLLGMVSDRDLRSSEIPFTLSDRLGDREKALLDQPITTVMSSDVVSVGPEAAVSELIDLMLENKVGALPIVEEETGDLLGIVSYVDVLRELRRTLD